jgi:hypothetical protein
MQKENFHLINAEENRPGEKILFSIFCAPFTAPLALGRASRSSQLRNQVGSMVTQASLHSSGILLLDFLESPQNPSDRPSPWSPAPVGTFSNFQNELIIHN